MVRFERLFRNRHGTALYAVLRTDDAYRVVEWEPSAGLLVEIVRFGFGTLGQSPLEARDLAIETARSEAAN